MRITVIGTGYLGAVHAAGMAELGHDVLGVDIDVEKIQDLSAGRAPFFEPGLQSLLQKNRTSGRLGFSSSIREAAEFGDVHFICVGTPQREGDSAADMRFVDAAVEALAAHLERPCLVVGKSTVPVGSAERLAARIAALAPVGAQAQLAWNPEFLREGFAIQDTLEPDRIVVGATSEHAVATLRAVYAPILEHHTPFISTDLATAELVKVSANAFLATKISFINAMAEVCEVVGADVSTLADAIGHDPRIGRRFLSSGLGFGGGCLGKDIRAFGARATELGVGDALTFLKAVDAINDGRRQRVIELARGMLGDALAGKRIAVLGAAFKPNSDDIRDSPSLKVAVMLHESGAEVRVHDPAAVDNARAKYPILDYTDEIEKVFEGADLVMHMTEWQEYRALDPVAVSGLVRAKSLLDARNTLDIDHWRAAGWTMRAMGRPTR